MRADKKGYRLPDNPTPLALRCVKLWIPDNQLYLEAFAGAYNDLGTWLVWEKDGTNRATLAAQTWKNAIDYTYANGWVDNCNEECPEMTDCCEELTHRIELLEQTFGSEGDCEMSNCGCGCNSQNMLNVTVITPPNVLPYEPPLSDEPPVLSPADSYKCGVAHYIAYVIRSILINTFDWQGTYGGWSEYLEGFFSWLADWLPGAGLIYAVYASVVGWLAGLTNDAAIVNAYNEIEESIVCAIYTSSTPAQAWGNVQSAIADGFSGSIVSRLTVQAIASLMPYSEAFAPNTVSSLPASFRARTCSCNEEPEQLPGGYLILPVLAGDTTGSTGSVHENIGGNIWRHVGTDGQSTVVVPDLSDQGYTWDDTDLDGIGAGYRMIKLSESGYVPANLDNDSFCFHGTINPWVLDNDYRDGVSDIDGWIAQGDADPGFLTTGNRLRFTLRSATSGTSEATFALWVVIRT